MNDPLATTHHAHGAEAHAERARLLRVNGVAMHVRVRGAGPPLVLLHGLTQDGTALDTEVARFSTNYRVVVIDSRGHGRSERPARFTLQDHADDVLAVMDALGLERAALMGTSMGSYVAQAVAIQAPHRVTRLVLAVSKSNGRTSSSARFLAEHAAELDGKSPEGIQAFLFERLFAPGTPAGPRAALQAYARHQAAEGLALTPEQHLAANRALEGFDFRPSLGEITAPTLVLSGRHDPLNPPREGRELAAGIPNATFVELERSGHVPILEEPERMLALIEAFLAS